MVVVAGHGGRFVSDNRLDYVQGNASVRRHRDECVTEAVERCLGRLPLAPLDLDGGYDARVLENLTYAVVNLAHSARTARRPRSDRREDIARAPFDGRLHEEVGENLVYGNRDRASLAVLLRLLGYLLDYRADDVHLGPSQLAAIAKAHARVHGDSK